MMRKNRIYFIKYAENYVTLVREFIQRIYNSLPWEGCVRKERKCREGFNKAII
jgi:hypothetical protein